MFPGAGILPARCRLLRQETTIAGNVFAASGRILPGHGRFLPDLADVARFSYVGSTGGAVAGFRQLRFPQAALRTGRARFHASGSPRIPWSQTTPSVQLPLDVKYPGFRFIEAWPRIVAIQRHLLPPAWLRFAVPLRHVTGFPDLGLLRGLRPVTIQQRTLRLPCQRLGRIVTVPTFTDFRSMGEVSRCTPAAPLRVHRSFLRRLEVSLRDSSRGDPREERSSRTAPTQIHQVRVGRSLKGLQPRIHFRYTFPSC